MSTRGRFLFALFLFFGLWLWSACAAPWTGTEPRRAVIARQMARSGDYLVPMHGGEPTLTKPPLHYQMQALAMAAFGSERWVPRLPATLMTLLLLCAFLRAGQRLGRGGAYAVAGALLLASHPLIGRFAASAEIDGPFAVWICLSLFALAQAPIATRATAWVAASAACAGLAALTKGPPMFLFLIPAWVPVIRRLGWTHVLLWLTIAWLPLATWLGGLELAGAFHDLAKVANVETVGRLSFWSWGRVLRIPLDLLKLAALLLPPLLLLGLPSRGEDPLPDDRRLALRVLLWGSLGGALLLCVFPHRATRYFLPAVAPLLFVLVHGSGPWLARTPRVVDAVKTALAVAVLVALPLLLIWAPAWVRALPAGALLGFWALTRRGLLVTCVGLGIAVQFVWVTDFLRRRRLPPRDMIASARAVAAVTGSGTITGWGYTPSELVWVLGNRLRCDEWMRGKELHTPWVVLFEVPATAPRRPLANLDVKARISTRKGSLVVAKVRDE